MSHTHHTPQRCPVCTQWPDWVLYLEARCNTIEQQNNRILTELGEIMALLDDLTTQVTQSTTVDQSALTLIEGISARLTAAAGDPAAVKALADQLNASSTALAAAVAQNTPAAPPVP